MLQEFSLTRRDLPDPIFVNIDAIFYEKHLYWIHKQKPFHYNVSKLVSLIL